MKLNTALKLSALAVAMGLTTVVNAATVNNGSVMTDPGKTWENVVTDPATTKDGSSFQFVDLGSSQEVIKTDKLVDNKVLSQLFKTSSGDFVLNVGDKFYKVDAAISGSGTVADPEKYALSNLVENADLSGSVVGLKPILGGLVQYNETKEEVSDDIKVVDSNFLQYGSTISEQNRSLTSAGNLTDDAAGGPEKTGSIAPSGPIISDKTVVSETLITVGNINAQTGKQFSSVDEKTYGLEIVKTVVGGDSQSTTLTLDGLTTTGNVSAKNVTADTITLAGTNIIETIDDKDAVTLASAKGYTDTTATAIRTEIAAGDAATLATARTELAAGDVATLATARTEFAAGDVATLATARTEIVAGNTATLASAKSYTDTQISTVNTRVSQLNKRVDDVEKTAYRGVAIALAAQQQVPNIKPGQYAVFGGVGHYEGESAVALGLVGALNERTSLSAAIGSAGSEVGGRVGVAYVFGAK